MSTASTAQQAREFFTGLQQRIVERIEEVDGTRFRRDQWERAEGGGGLSCVMEEGNVLERGGVNYSHVFGGGLPASATAARPELSGRGFEAMGVSLVLHPRNPYAPTVHLNVRYLEARKEGAEPVWWFGGGMDLTPYYGFEEDAVHFHQTCKNALQPFGEDYHPRFKKWCDEYFYLKHRKEPRGIGGIFFDDLGQARFRNLLQPHQKRRRSFPRSLRPDPRAPPEYALRRARTRLPGLPPRPLCRIQSRVGPWHPVRPAIRRAHRIHPHVAAATREMALRLEARAGQC